MPTARTVCADGSPVFHLDFTSFQDVSGNSLPIDVGEAVSLVPGGGPTLAGGVTLDAARWEGEEDDTNQIVIFDNDVLDAVTVGAGSIVAWIKPEDGDEWNNITGEQQRGKPGVYANTQGFRDGIQTPIGKEVRGQLFL